MGEPLSGSGRRTTTRVGGVLAAGLIAVSCVACGSGGQDVTATPAADEVTTSSDGTAAPVIAGLSLAYRDENGTIALQSSSGDEPVVRDVATDGKRTTVATYDSELWTSTDGTNWVPLSNPPGADDIYGWYAIAYADGLWVALAQFDGGSGPAAIATSTDGVTFDVAARCGEDLAHLATDGAGRWAATVKDDTSEIALSDDGRDWRCATGSGSSNAGPIAWDSESSLWVTSKSRSADGLAWSESSRPVFADAWLADIESGDRLFVGVEEGGAVVCGTSPSKMEQVYEYDGPDDLRYVTRTATGWWIVGDDVALRSDDCRTWEPVPVPPLPGS